MKPSSASPKNLKSPLADFDLEPVEEPPVSRLPPLVSLDEMTRRIRQLRDGFPEGIRSPEERWRDKTTDPFIL